MKLQFKRIVLFIFLLLVTVFLFQGYWLLKFYEKQSSKLDMDLLDAVRTADYKEIHSKENNHILVSLDTLKSFHFPAFFDFFQAEIIQKEIIVKSFIELVDLEKSMTLSCIPTDTIDFVRSSYHSLVYPLDIEGKYAYRINVRYPMGYLIRQMGGVLGTSFLMIVLLLLAFLYLLKVIYRQKNADEIKSDFVNNMTHELKTPISVAYAATDALLNYGVMEDTSKREVYLNTTKKQLTHLNGLVEQILTMSIDERKKLKLSLEPISILRLFTQLKEQTLLNTFKSVELTISVEPEDLILQADAIHFQNAVNNLIENAVKYSGDQVKISLEAQLFNQQIRISVKDNGIGMQEQHLPHIFERFVTIQPNA